MKNGLKKYLEKAGGNVDVGFAAYLSNLDLVSDVYPEIAASIVKELENQRVHLKLIASENFSSLSTQATMGNLLTDKYAEGYPEHRYYGGCENVDAVESAACKLACEIFGADHAYVQPHSGADANMVAYWAILNAKVEEKFMKKFETVVDGKVKKGSLESLSKEDWEELRHILGDQKLMGLDYYSGGHLTHGYVQNVSSKMFRTCSYTVDKETGVLDYDAIEKQALEEKPLILLAGYSAYPRKINFKRFREIADKCGAVFMVDMAHFAGLVAGKVFEGEYNPVLWADVVTTTTHKTLRGPRGAMVLCKKEFAEAVDKGCPLVLGGPLPHVMAAKAVAFKEAASKDFQDYAKRVRDNAAAMADECTKLGMKLQTNGTDNHLILINVTGYGINGRQAETAMSECGVTLNRNSLPFDPNGPWWTSGLRIGTPAITSLGLGEKEARQIAHILHKVLSATKPGFTKSGKPSKAQVIVDPKVKEEAIKEVNEILAKFVLYPNLDLDFMKEVYC
ncbi:MAG: serine hydroxymethyltransferase [Treponema sp.]|nr:MAG: serine hydroxymethyltransferase [Treponema sp.]